MRLQGAAVVVLGSALVAILTGCTSHGPVDYVPPQPTGIEFLSAPPASMAVNASATLEASYSSANGPLGTGFDMAINWVVTCSTSNACGTIGPSQETGAVLFTAPSTVPKGGTVTITASGDGFSVSATVTITPPVPIQVSFFAPPPASLDVSTTFPLAALIANDTSPEPEVSWSAACGSSNCGSFRPTTTESENPTTYTAPAAVPADGTVTVTMTSVADPTKTASASIAVTSAPTATLANGTYVFQISAVPGYSANFITGVIVTSDGSITGGEQDVANFNGTGQTNAFTAQQVITGGSYGFTPDGNLRISIDAGVGQTESLEGSLAANGQGLVSGIDGAAASGTLDLQTSTAAPGGGYAVSLSGGDPDYDGTWIGGIVNVDGSGTISGAGSELDVNDPGLVTGTVSLGPGTVSRPDQFGRVVMMLYPAQDAGVPPIYLAAYTIDGKRMRLVETQDAADNTNFQGVMGGTALAQGAGTGHFSPASLAGDSFVLGGQGIDLVGELDLAGIVTLQPDGSVTGLLNWNDQSGTSAQSPLPASGRWSVDSTGRVTITDLSDGSTFAYSLYMYLAGSGQGLLQSNDENDDFDGELFQQQAGANLSGNYGLSASEWAYNSAAGGVQALNVAGTVTATTAPAGDLPLNGYADTGAGLADFAITGQMTGGADGVWTGTLAGFTPGARGSSSHFSLYVVDSTQAVLMETDNAQLLLGRIGTLP
jgi:hypothetical protein